jgi:hypothetical protein
MKTQTTVAAMRLLAQESMYDDRFLDGPLFTTQFGMEWGLAADRACLIACPASWFSIGELIHDEEWDRKASRFMHAKSFHWFDFHAVSVLEMAEWCGPGVWSETSECSCCGNEDLLQVPNRQALLYGMNFNRVVLARMLAALQDEYAYVAVPEGWICSIPERQKPIVIYDTHVLTMAMPCIPGTEDWTVDWPQDKP